MTTSQLYRQWSYATAELEKVTAGERAQPGIEEFVGELPAFVWP